MSAMNERGVGGEGMGVDTGLHSYCLPMPSVAQPCRKLFASCHRVRATLYVPPCTCHLGDFLGRSGCMALL